MQIRHPSISRGTPAFEVRPLISGRAETHEDRSQDAYARLAGVMYFFTVFDVTGVIILSRISGNGTFFEIAHRVAASETLYRIGILCGLIGNLSTILLAISLYEP